MKKNYILAVCMLFLILAFTACDGSEKKEEASSGKTYDIGIELSASLSELSKYESYGDASLPEGVADELVSNIRAMDYSQPEHVYRVKNIDEVMNAGMYMMEIDNESSSDMTRKHIESIFVNGISNIITARRTGATALAVKTTFSIETSFVDTSVKACEVYVYTYKDAYPVMVCYVPGKDGSVVATAGYIIVDDYIGADGDTFSKDIGFAMLNIKLEEVFKQ